MPISSAGELASVSSPSDKAVCSSLISGIFWRHLPELPAQECSTLPHPGAHHAGEQQWHQGCVSPPANSKPAAEQVRTEPSPCFGLIVRRGSVFFFLYSTVSVKAKESEMLHGVTDELAALPPQMGRAGCWARAVSTACFDTMWKWTDMQCSQELPENYSKAAAQLYEHMSSLLEMPGSVSSPSLVFLGW